MHDLRMQVLLLGILLYVFGSYLLATHQNERKRLLFAITWSILGLFLSSTHPYAIIPEKPQVEIKLTPQVSNYREGLEIYRVKWQKNYKVYDVGIINNSRLTEINDVKLEFNLPGFIISKNLDGLGTDKPQMYSFNPPMNLTEHGEIQEVKTGNTNNITMQADKIKVGGRLLSLTVLDLQTELSEKGLVDVSYSFTGLWQKKEMIRMVYAIRQKEGSFFIDTSQTLPTKTPRTFSFRADGFSSISDTDKQNLQK